MAQDYKLDTCPNPIADVFWPDGVETASVSDVARCAAAVLLQSEKLVQEPHTEALAVGQNSTADIAIAVARLPADSPLGPHYARRLNFQCATNLAMIAASYEEYGQLMRAAHTSMLDSGVSAGIEAARNYGVGQGIPSEVRARLGKQAFSQLQQEATR